MTARLRLVGSLHHGGLLYHRIEQAGLSIVDRNIAEHSFLVDGDPQVVQQIIDTWDGEGRVEQF